MALQEIRETIVERKGLVILARTIMRRSKQVVTSMEESSIAKRKRDELMAVVEKKTMKHKHDMRRDARIRAERSPHLVHDHLV